MPQYQFVPVDHDPFTSFIPVDHDPFAPTQDQALASSMTHWPEAPNPAQPYIQGTKDFLKGGLSEVLKGQGVQLPEWSNRVGDVLQSEAANTAIGMTVPLKGAGAFKAATESPSISPFKISDTGNMLHIEPHDMEVPEWGKGLKWGLTAYRTSDRNGQALTIRDVRLPPDMQRQGLGSAMYQHAADIAAKEGVPLHSDSTVTEAAVNSWMRLHRSGQEVALSPKASYRPGPPEAPELGRLETDDGSPVFRIAPPSPSITAYHGSPYDFEKFDLSKIGTGEGAQAYGHGLYFAENPEVAGEYKRNVSRGGLGQYESMANEILRQEGDNREAAIARARDLEEKARQQVATTKPWATYLIEEASRARQLIEQGWEPPKGKMYQVSIKADPEHFLDWDKPLSEQSEHVKGALGLDKLPQKPTPQQVTAALKNPEELQRLRAQHNAAWDALGIENPGHRASPGEMTGGEYVLAKEKSKYGQQYHLANKQGGASDEMRQIGIPGIKYLDQGSRLPTSELTENVKTSEAILQRVKEGDYWDKSITVKDAEQDLAKARAVLEANKPTRNYVVFDDKLIDILKKYGLAGLIGGGAYHFRTQQVDHDPFETRQ